MEQNILNVLTQEICNWLLNNQNFSNYTIVFGFFNCFQNKLVLINKKYLNPKSCKFKKYSWYKYLKNLL